MCDRNCLPTAFQEETEQRRQGKDRKGSLAGRQSACTLPQVLLLQDIQVFVMLYILLLNGNLLVMDVEAK